MCDTAFSIRGERHAISDAGTEEWTSACPLRKRASGRRPGGFRAPRSQARLLATLCGSGLLVLAGHRPTGPAGTMIGPGPAALAAGHSCRQPCSRPGFEMKAPRRVLRGPPATEAVSTASADDGAGRGQTLRQGARALAGGALLFLLDACIRAVRGEGAAYAEDTPTAGTQSSDRILYDDVRVKNVNLEDLQRSMSDEDFIAATEKLTALQQTIAIDAATEPQYSGRTANGYQWNTMKQGVYTSVMSGLPLFSSGAKYDSGTGWASFWAPIDASRVLERIDPNDKARKPEKECRIQVLDRASKTHVGHVFPDPRSPSGKRYRINSCVFRFEPGPAPAGDAQQALAGWKMA